MQLLAGMSWQIQEGVNLGHTDSLWTVSNFYNVIACTNFSLLQHAKVESWSVMCYEQGCHPRFIHANADAVARYAWLRYFKFSITDAVSIADAHLVIRKSLDGEVFSELAESKIVAAQKALPVMVRVHLVDEYGAVLPSVTREIGLRIALILSLRTIRRPSTGDFQTDVRTVLPFHVTSRGRPTFTESNRGMHTSSKSSVGSSDKLLLSIDHLSNLPASQ